MAKRKDEAAGRKGGRAKPGRDASGPVDVTALTARELAELLGVSLSEIKAHADDGAPVGADGRVNLVEFAAWANRRLQRARPR